MRQSELLIIPRPHPLPHGVMEGACGAARPSKGTTYSASPFPVQLMAVAANRPAPEPPDCTIGRRIPKALVLLAWYLVEIRPPAAAGRVKADGCTCAAIH